MGERGRKSAASMQVAKVGEDHRLAPQPDLTPAEKAIWVSVVNSRPADWFSDVHGGILAQFCRHKVQSDVIAAQMHAFDPEWLADDEGLKRYDLLGKMLARETTAMNQLMRAMRLTQQSLIEKDRAIKSKVTRRPWQSDD